MCGDFSVLENRTKPQHSLKRGIYLKHSQFLVLGKFPLLGKNLLHRRECLNAVVSMTVLLQWQKIISALLCTVHLA